MVRDGPVGGRLNLAITERLAQAARLMAQGHTGEAAALYREILALSPNEPTASHMLGLIAHQLGKHDLAIQLIDAALTARPDYAEARFNRCVILLSLDRKQEALDAARALLALDPTFAAAWDLCGQILKDIGSLDDALRCHLHATGLQPSNAHFLGNYALLLFTQGNLTEAYRLARRAAHLNPAYPPMLEGNILKIWGYPEQAAACFARVRALAPHLGDAAASEAMARLQMGDWETGWALWAQRPALNPALTARPAWRGQPIDHLFLYEDQGLGDAIQFLRYLPLVIPRARHITLRLRPPLRRLCAANFPSLTLIDEEASLPEHDAQCRLASLPCVIAPTAPPPAPYLSARTIPAPQSPSAARIGLIWAGNPKFRNDAARSIPANLLAPLLAIGPENFLSLQCDAPTPLPDGLTDAAPLLHDLADTAALMESLALVITVDTATAHLAGALGKPVWILLPFNSDWRWQIEREDSPWYPSARLFRQKTAGDWTAVIEAIAAETRRFLANDLSVLRAKEWNAAPLRQNPYALPLPV